ANAGMADRAVEAIDLRAGALHAASKASDAAAVWKSALEKFPAHRRYREMEAKVKDAAGLSADARDRAELSAWYERAVGSCARGDLGRAAEQFIAFRERTEGLYGVRRTIYELDRACGGDSELL